MFCMEYTSLVKYITEREGMIEEALRELGDRPPKSLSKEEVITWLGFKAQLGLIREISKEIRDGNIRE